jgi:hypothetical protein
MQRRNAMNIAYVITGNIKNRDTIKLDEPVPFEDGEIRIVIERQQGLKRPERKPSLWKGRIRVADDFGSPL